MINVSMQPQEVQKLSPKITVVGVGGAGGNAVNNMIASNLEGVEFLVCNTDAQALETSQADTRAQLGVSVTGGLGAGARPDIGRAAAEESLDEVMQNLEDANMVFITGGMGGGTASGAAPIIAQACRERGILTVGVVTKPFHFEGTLRMKVAEQAISEMQDYVDTLIIIPNQNLFRVANEKTTFAEAFRMADGVLQSGVRGVTDLIVMPGLINLDFADIRSAMTEMGKAMMGTGEATGDKRAVEAAESAINNPLLDDITMQGARGVIINITGGYDMTLFEADEACNRIRDEVDPEANIIFGSTFDESLEGVMRVSVVATGIDSEETQNGGNHAQAGVSADHENEHSTARTIKNFAMQAGRPQYQDQTGMQGGNQQTDEDQSHDQSQSNHQQDLSSGAGEALKQAAVQAGNVAGAREQGRVAQMAAQRQQKSQTVSQPQQQSLQSAQVSQGSQGQEMRGTRYQGAFIPPQPAEASQYHQPQQQAAQQDQRVAQASGAEQVGSAQADIAQAAGTAPTTRHTEQAQAVQTAQSQDRQQTSRETESGNISLNPPVPGQNAQHQRRRSPTLFERITGQARGDEDEPLADKTPAQKTGPQEQKAPQQPAQGRLNIESPADSGQSGEDELDIPAFLRRQAN